MRRPALAVLTLLALSLGVVAGCSNTSSEPSREAVPAAATPPALPPPVNMTAEESYLAGLDVRGVTSTLSKEQVIQIGQAACSLMPTMGREELVDTIAIERAQGDREAAVALVDSAGAHLCPSAGSVAEPVEPVEPVVPAPAPEPQPETTVSQQNALRSAESYLSFSAFSRTGLIKQLEYEEFSTADAEFAVERVVVDWMEQAAKSAKSYLEFSSFSRSGLIDQLEYEGFTSEQAEHGANSVGL